MKTEQIIKTLQEYNDWRRGIGKWGEEVKENYFNTISAHELGLTIDAAIERLQELELTVARYERIYDPEANAEVEREYRRKIRQLGRERDEARREAKTIRCFLDAGVYPVFPWEVDSK